MRYLLLILFFTSSLFASSKHPYSILNKEFYESGELFYNPNLSSKTFLISTDWANDSETIYTWDGIEKGRSAAITLSDQFLIDAIQIDRGIVLLSHSEGVLNLMFLDETPEILQTIEIPVNYTDIDKYGLLKIKDNLYLIASGNLYQIEIKQNKLKMIDKYVDEATGDNNHLYYIQDQNGLNFLCKYDLENNTKENKLIEISTINRIKRLDDKIIIFSSQPNVNQTNILIYNNKSLELLNSFWIDASLDLIDVKENNKKLKFIYIERNKNKLFLVSSNNNIQNNTVDRIELPQSIIEPISLDIIEDKIISIFKNAVIINDLNLNIISFDHIPISETNQSPEIFLRENHLMLREHRGTLVLKINENKYWIINKYSDLALKFILPIVLFIIIIITIQMFRHQKRIFSELLDLPSSGIIMEFDSSGRLLRANTRALDFIKYHRGMPRRKIFSYYLSDKKNEDIVDFINSALQNKTDKSEKIEISMDNSLKEWLCSAITLRNVAGMFRGIVFTAIDITEQLERKRLTNWAQLAHDMQTNLSTIRLNTENLESDNDNNTSRKKKILHQVNVIMQRVRDIVTVGRSNELERINASAADICISARSEFDETVFPDVSFDLKLEYFSFYCDNKKLIRAVRNAIENAIKALPGKKGTIIVSCRKESNNAIFSIKDSGIGMNDKTRKKMMQPYFTTAENKGGFGIGTMIMQHVAEMHDGKIEVFSKENIGTEVIFKIPLVNEK